MAAPAQRCPAPARQGVTSIQNSGKVRIRQAHRIEQPRCTSSRRPQPTHLEVSTMKFDDDGKGRGWHGVQRSALRLGHGSGPATPGGRTPRGDPHALDCPAHRDGDGQAGVAPAGRDIDRQQSAGGVRAICSSRCRPTRTWSRAARRRWCACSSTTAPVSEGWCVSTTRSASTRSRGSASTKRTGSTS